MTSQLNTQSEIFRHSTSAKAPVNVGLSATRLALQLYARVSPRKAGQLFNRMAFRPSRLPMPTRYEHLLDNTDSYTQLQHGSRTIPVYSWGQGPVILGVHGWAGAGIQFGAWVDPLVEAGYRVVLFDAPAHGRAQGESTDLFEMADVTARVAATMKSLGRQFGLSPEALSVHLQLMEEQFGASVWDELNLETLSLSLTQQGLIVIDDDDTSVSPEESQRVAGNWARAEVLRTSGLGHHRLLWSPMVVETVLRDLVSGKN